ncbi:MAG: acyl-CoA thioesterase [Gemmatimonadota bacterium]|jgi:acyl-CoA thioester hydrolase|nr:acyl-CoA thioesterase [Gemmatimonadota bacterium]
MNTETLPIDISDPVEVDLRVRYAETDQMGVVYHTNYLIWCEVARTELIRRRYLPYSELERRGVILAVSDLSIRYRAPARYEDDIRVSVRVSELRSRTVTFLYEISRLADGALELLATATTTLIALGDDKRPRKLPADLISALSNG